MSETFPLSAAQRRLWYMAQQAEQNPYYNVTLIWRLRFAADRAAIRAAVRALVSRHEILRTCYPVVNGVPRQQVLPLPAEVVREEICLPGENPDAAVRRFTRRVARTVLHLESGPLFQPSVLRLSANDFVLAVVMHHLVIDQWSIQVIARELAMLYDAFETGTAPALPPPIQYREYITWEARRQERSGARLVEYWDRQLTCPPRLLPLPYDRLPRGRGTNRGREHRFTIASETAKRLRTWCRTRKASPFVAMMALYAALLVRCTKQERMTIGTTVAFRHDPRFRETVGCFVNPLAIVVDLSGCRTFDDALARLRTPILDGLAHAELSYETVVQRVRALNAGHNGELINAYLQFQPKTLAVKDDGQRFRPDLGVHNGRAKYALMLNISERDDTFDCVLEYERDRFTTSRIEAIARDFVRLVEAGVADPDGALATPALECDGWSAIAAAERIAPAPALRPVSQHDHKPVLAKLTDIWRDLLLVDAVTPDDDFLLLGGSSLLLATLAWRIRNELGARVRVSELGIAGTLGAMADLIVDAPPIAAQAPDRPSTSAERLGGIPCHLELGTWSPDALRQLFSDANGLTRSERVRHFANAFRRTPFQFESRRPLPMPGRLPFRLGAFDCITFVYTAVAMAAASDLDEAAQMLYRLRYANAASGRIDSHPETGNILDFAEESLLTNAVELGMVEEVTREIAGDRPIVELRKRLAPVQRTAGFDPAELWATPKLGDRPIGGPFLSASDLAALQVTQALASGDIVLMSRGEEASSLLIDHVGIVERDPDGAYLLQATRHFAWRPAGGLTTEGTYSGIFYDSERTREQIGVGIAGTWCPDATFESDGLPYYGYLPDVKRPLADYVISNFRYVTFLRLR